MQVSTLGSGHNGRVEWPPGLLSVSYHWGFQGPELGGGYELGASRARIGGSKTPGEGVKGGAQEEGRARGGAGVGLPGEGMTGRGLCLLTPSAVAV